MSSMTHVLFLLIVVFASAMFLHSDVIAAHPTSGGLHKRCFIVSNVDPALANICKKTSYPRACISTISPLRKGRKADPTVALKAEIEATTVRVGATKQILHKLAADPAISKPMMMCLDQCSQFYEVALYRLQESIKFIDSHDQFRVVSKLSSFLTEITTCNDSFDEIPGLKNPIIVPASRVAKLGSNCLSIAQYVTL